MIVDGIKGWWSGRSITTRVILVIATILGLLSLFTGSSSFVCLGLGMLFGRCATVLFTETRVS